MKTIYILNGNLGYGGAIKILVEIANYFSKNGYSVKFITYTNSDVFYKLEPNIQVENISAKFNRIPKIRRLFQLFYIRKIVKSEKPDVLLAFENMAKLLAVFASLFTKTKVIISERKDPYRYNAKKKRHMHLRYMLADGCIFQTEQASKYFPKSVQKKSIVIPNFIMMERSKVVPGEQRKDEISFVARFELEQKRQDIMLMAFKKILLSHPNIKLVFYGDGPDKKTVERMVSDYRLENNVVFKGVVSDVFEQIKSSKVFVLTSEYEGIPNALIEAMALGVPVVSTDCSPGGAALLIDNYQNGILVPVNDVDRIAEAINGLLDDPVQADKLGRKGQEITERFKPEAILPLWKNYINGVLTNERT